MSFYFAKKNKKKKNAAPYLDGAAELSFLPVCAVWQSERLAKLLERTHEP